MDILALKSMILLLRLSCHVDIFALKAMTFSFSDSDQLVRDARNVTTLFLRLSANDVRLALKFTTLFTKPSCHADNLALKSTTFSFRLSDHEDSFALKSTTLSFRFSAHVVSFALKSTIFSFKLSDHSAIFALNAMIFSFSASDHSVSFALKSISNPISLKAFRIGCRMLSLIQVPIFLIAFSRPSNRPAMIKPPCSSITVDGDAIPNAFLNPSINGLKMLSTIQVPIFLRPSQIPFSSPSIVNCPSSKAVSFHHSTTPFHASSMSPSRNAARPPSAAPMPSDRADMMPDQSIFLMQVATFLPSCRQSTSSTNLLIDVSAPFNDSPIVFPSVAQSILSLSPLTDFPRACPAPAQLKLWTTP